MRVAFFGTPAFAVPSLRALHADGHTIAAVITQPDRAQGRSHSTLVAPPVKQCAIELGLSVLQPDRPRGAEFYDALRASNIDLGVVVAYGHLLLPELIGIPKWGLVNVHASLLPRWRGAAPIQRAILANDAETGVSIMRIEAGLDTGAVWLTRATPITATDTSGNLTERLAQLGASALHDALPAIARGDAPTPQPEGGVTHAAKIDRSTARMQWNASAEAVAAQIRAMDPAPGAWSTLEGLDLKLFGATAFAGVHLEPGLIAMHEDEVIVGALSGAVVLDEVQPSGKKRMPATTWWRGRGAAASARFT